MDEILLHLDDKTYAWLKANVQGSINEWIVDAINDLIMNAINAKKALIIQKRNSDELAKLADAEVVYEKVTAGDIASKLNKNTTYTFDDLAEKLNVKYMQTPNLEPWLTAHGYKVNTALRFAKFTIPE